MHVQSDSFLLVIWFACAILCLSSFLERLQISQMGYLTLNHCEIPD